MGERAGGTSGMGEEAGGTGGMGEGAGGTGGIGEGQEGQVAWGKRQDSLSMVLSPEFTALHLGEQMWGFLAILTPPPPMVHSGT